MSTVVINLPPEITPREFMLLIAASTNSVPGSVSAVLRRSTNDGFPMEEEKARAVVMFARAWSVSELAKSSGVMTNGLQIGMVQS